MTISNTTRKIQYTGNGSSTVFSFAFKVFSAADLAVYLADLSGGETLQTLTTHYSVTLNPDQNSNPGGSVTMVTAPPTGYKLAISSAQASTQTLDLSNGDAFNADNLENAFDRLAIAVQQLEEKQSRSVTTSITSAQTAQDLLTSLNTSVASAASSASSASTSATAAAGSATAAASSATAAANSAASVGFTAADIQNSNLIKVTAGGTVDAITGSISPAPAALVNGMFVQVRASGANASATPTFNLNSLGAKTIVKPANQPLSAGDIAGAAHWLELVYDSTLDKWVLENPASYDQLQSISASVAANALTVGLNPVPLSFRSTTLTSGVPVARTFTSALSLTVPSGATLGTVNAQLSRIVLLAIDNAGTVELAVVNISGGNQLDETNLISTTAISGTSNSANVIYSQTARTNVAYRVVGVVDSTQATAGTWASAPSLVQPAGGQAVAAMASMGYGQTYQDVTASRTVGTTYYNTTGRPIHLYIKMDGAASTYGSITVNGVTLVGIASPSGTTASAQAIVPPGGSYSAVNNVSITINKWIELR